MHIEFLVEDSSGKKLLEIVIPKLLGSNWCHKNSLEQGAPNTWGLESYKGLGSIPKKLSPGQAKSVSLLKDLPRVLSGFGKTPGIDSVIVVLDLDRNDPKTFPEQLASLALKASPKNPAVFHLAIEEMEAWYFGDLQAVTKAYPRAKLAELKRYKQDTVCDTWECLADAIHSQGRQGLPFPLSGQAKHEWAERIGPLLDIDNNSSPSFCAFRDGVRQLANRL